jgi:single-strand DNA-binding protein
MNNCTFIGNLGQDPEIKYLESGDAVCSFSIGVRGKKKGETIWVKVSTWGKNAENCSTYLAKGKKVAVVGSASVRAYRNKDGEPAASLELNANQVEFLSEKSEESPKKPEQGSSFKFLDSDDCPF